MSVETTADERLYQAKSWIKLATSALSEIVVDQCWGHDEFKEEYKKKIRNTFDTLIILRDTLGE